MSPPQDGGKACCYAFCLLLRWVQQWDNSWSNGLLALCTRSSQRLREFGFAPILCSGGEYFPAGDFTTSHYEDALLKRRWLKFTITVTVQCHAFGCRALTVWCEQRWSFCAWIIFRARLSTLKIKKKEKNKHKTKIPINISTGPQWNWSCV